jgi:hypothetical protein
MDKAETLCDLRFVKAEYRLAREAENVPHGAAVRARGQRARWTGSSRCGLKGQFWVKEEFPEAAIPAIGMASSPPYTRLSRSGDLIQKGAIPKTKRPVLACKSN